jgi:hypothetical protein
MKNSNHSLLRRFAVFFAGLPLLVKAVSILLVVVVILGLAAGGWFIYHICTSAIKTIPTPPKDTNDTSFYQVYDTGGECATFTNIASNAAALLSPPASGMFAFQYGMCSTNPRPVVWLRMGTNLVGVDPFPSNNITAPEGVLWTLQDTPDTYDIIYYIRNVLYRSTAVSTNDDVYDANLAFVLSKALPPAYSWQPIYTNAAPIMDYPYTFTDTNATDPAALYQGGWQ